MPGYVNGIPHATSTDRIDLWPTTSRTLAQWVDDNVPRNDDPRLSDARPPSAHTHDLGDVTGLQDTLDGKTDTTDPRLSDARPPTTHTHDLGDVTGLTARLAALEYDSDWRDVSTSLTGGTTGVLHIRRVGMAVHWRIKNYAAGTSHPFYTPPSGFRSTTDANAYPASKGSVSNTFFRHMDGRLCRSIHDPALPQGFWFEGSYALPPGTPIPATPPGTPA